MIERIYKNEIRNNGKPILFVMIGLPASGKSTSAARLCKEYNARWCTSDGIRGEIFGDESKQGNNTVIFEVMKERTEESLTNGESVVYDATNLVAKKRKNLLNHDLKGIDCWKIAYVVLADIKECRRRNSIRSRKVPDNVIDRMLKSFQFPWWGEGWDEIIIEKTDETTYLLQDYLLPLMDMPHDSKYHDETIGEHLFDVAHSKKMNTPFLKNTALLHDIGKGYCKVFSNVRGEPTDEAHYYGHSFVSAYMSMYVKDRLPFEKKLMRAILIQWHMEHYMRDSKGMKKLEDELGPTMWELLERLMEADKNPPTAWRDMSKQNQDGYYKID